MTKRFYEVVDKNREVSSITNNDILAFKQHLINIRHYANETAAGYLKKLKTMFKWAVINDKISKNPFLDMKIGSKQKDVVPLTQQELARIERLSFPIERLAHVKDCFLFSCYTGIAFCDISSLTKADILTQGKVRYISRKRAKTDIQYVVPLSLKAMELLEKYDYRLPIVSNQKTNMYLKEIADLAGITKNLHFHLARHTALTLMLANGIPIEIVSKIAGHSNIKQTQHYAKVLEQSVLAHAEKLQ